MIKSDTPDVQHQNDLVKSKLGWSNFTVQKLLIRRDGVMIFEPKFSALLSIRMPHARKTMAFFKKIIDILEIFKLEFKFHASISAEQCDKNFLIACRGCEYQKTVTFRKLGVLDLSLELEYHFPVQSQNFWNFGKIFLF